MRYPLQINSASDFMPIAHRDLPLLDELYGRGSQPTAELTTQAHLVAGVYSMGRQENDKPVWEWCFPNERAVLLPDYVHVSKTTRYQARRAKWHIAVRPQGPETQELIRLCASIQRGGYEELDDEYEWVEWLDEPAIAAFSALDNAYSVIAYNQGKIAGGFFGLHFDTYATIESMCSVESGASKACMGVWPLIGADLYYVDMEEFSDHLVTMGATQMAGTDFLKLKDKFGGAPHRGAFGTLDFDRLYG